MLSITNYWSLYSALSQGWACTFGKTHLISAQSILTVFFQRENHLLWSSSQNPLVCAPLRRRVWALFGRTFSFSGHGLVIHYLPCQYGSLISLPRYCICVSRQKTVQKRKHFKLISCFGLYLKLCWPGSWQDLRTTCVHTLEDGTLWHGTRNGFETGEGITSICYCCF